jgi:hypothetical protein
MQWALRAFAPVLMLMIAVSFGAPSSFAATAKADCDQACCCVAACHCPMSGPCSPTCREAQAPLPDKQSPVRPAQAPAVRLFVVAEAFPAETAPCFLLPAIFDRCELNASPPLGGNPQQAVLRLWRI